MAAWSGAIPTDWETRQPVEIRCGRGIHSSWMATPRCRGAACAIREYGGAAAGDAPAWARMRHAARSTGGGGESNPMRHAPDRGRGGHRIRQAAASRDFWNVRGARGDTADVLHRSRDCRGVRGSGGGLGGIPGRTVNRHRNRDAIGAEQEAGGPCRMRHAAVAASDGKATASRGFTQQCGSVSSSSKDGGSPSNTKRPTPARAADAASGAVDPSRCTLATDAPAGLPARRGSWPFPYRIDKHAVVDAPGGRP